jgi:hypothetical protein
MEETMISGMGQLASYGALGIAALYFMVKDWLLSSKLNEALKDFTVALNLLCAKVDE